MANDIEQAEPIGMVLRYTMEELDKARRQASDANARVELLEMLLKDAREELDKTRRSLNHYMQQAYTFHEDCKLLRKRVEDLEFRAKNLLADCDAAWAKVAKLQAASNGRVT